MSYFVLYNKCINYTIAQESVSGRRKAKEEKIMTNKMVDTMWDDAPINVTQEANFIWSIANKLRGSYMPDKYGDVIIPMTIIRRFECALGQIS